MKLLRLFIGKIMAVMFGFQREYEISKLLKLIDCKGSINGTFVAQYPKNIHIGQGTYVNGGGYLCASPNAHIFIGENCLVSYNVHMRTDMHNYDNRLQSINTQGYKESNIVIGNDVWIGFGAQIMAGVSISDGCIIGAGAIVTKDTEPYSVYVGIPVKKVKERMLLRGNGESI